MKYQLVLQWLVSRPEEYAAVPDIYECLEETMSEIAVVDGYDRGSGEMNVFMETDEPLAAFHEARPTLEALNVFATVRVAYRDMDEEEGEYTILWPQALTTFEVG